jgi:hypothetical protein
MLELSVKQERGCRPEGSCLGIGDRARGLAPCGLGLFGLAGLFCGADEHLVYRHSPIAGDDVGDGIGDVLGPQWLDGFHCALGRLADVFANVRHEFCIDGAWLDDAHAYVVAGELLAQ